MKRRQAKLPKTVRFPRPLLDRYQPIRVLGAGGMGAVFLAREDRAYRNVAVKILRQPEKSSLKTRFLREAGALSRVDHPHVLSILDFGETPEGPFLVTEYVEGERLDRVAEAEDPTPWLLSIAEALETMHDLGLVHRDVKPSNIMITDEGHPVLIDLGLVHDQADTTLTQEGSVVGTASFIAPELMRGERPTAACDWYSLGVCLYVTIEKRFPYDMPQLLQIAAGKPVDPPPFQVLGPEDPRRRLIMRCLAPDPDRRPQGSAEMRALLAGEIPASRHGETMAPAHPGPAEEGETSTMDARGPAAPDPAAPDEPAAASTPASAPPRATTTPASDPPGTTSTPASDPPADTTTPASSSADGSPGPPLDPTADPERAPLATVSASTAPPDAPGPPLDPTADPERAPPVAVAAATAPPDAPGPPLDPTADPERAPAPRVDSAATPLENRPPSSARVRRPRPGPAPRSLIEQLRDLPPSALTAIGSALGLVVLLLFVLVAHPSEPSPQPSPSAPTPPPERPRATPEASPLVASASPQPPPPTPTQAGPPTPSAPPPPSPPRATPSPPDAPQAGPRLAPRVTLRAHRGAVRSLAFDPLGRWLVSGSTDTSLRAWKVGDGTPAGVLRAGWEAVGALAWSKSGEVVAAGTADGTVLIWDPARQEVSETLMGHEGAVSDLAWTPAGRLVSLGRDGWLNTWTLGGSLQGRRRRVPMAPRNPVAAFGVAPGVLLLGHLNDQGSLDVRSPDGTRVAGASLGTSPPRALALHPTQGRVAYAFPDGRVDVGSFDGGAPRALEAAAAPLTCLTFSPDGGFLAGGDRSGALSIWDLGTGRKVSEVGGHQGPVYALAASASGADWASGGYDGAVRLWRWRP